MARTDLTRIPPFAAVFSGDLQAVKMYLSNLAKIEKDWKNYQTIIQQHNDRGQTMLYLASRFGHKDIVEELLKPDPCAFFVDKPNADGSTALHGACFGGHAEIVSLLLENGASKTIKNNGKELPQDNANHPAEGVAAAAKRATVAAIKKSKRVTRTVATAATSEEEAKKEELPQKAVKKEEKATNATASSAAPTGITPEAETEAKPNNSTPGPKPDPPKLKPNPNEHDEAMQALSAEGVALTANGDLAGLTALLPKLNDQAKLEVLMKISWMSKAKASVKKVLPAIVKAVLKSGFEIGNTNSGENEHRQYINPLYLSWDCYEIVYDLLAHGIKPIFDRVNHMDYVHLKILSDHPESMSAYLDYTKQHVDDTVKYGQTPLLYAARVNSHKCLKELLKRGADVNKVVRGNFALLQAIRQYDKWSNRKEELVQILVDAGANCDMIVPDAYGCEIKGKHILDVIRPKNERVKEVIKRGIKK